MIGYFLLFQIFATVAGKPNLNPGFDINAFRQEQLNLHNYYRAKHGVPLMTLDNTLTQQAQSYAEELAAIDGGLNHCRLPSCDRHGAGENLASAWGSTTTETNATKAWYDEIWDYNFCTGKRRPGHEGEAIGHFTQIVWKTSIKLGIGYARTSKRTKVYVVARYLKHGNVRNRYPDNVLKPSYILQTFQDNCDGTNGGLTDWSAPGQCTRSCGGGVQFKTKTCTNPKPSLNGRDCDGPTKELVQEWCNTQSCSGTKSHRNEQCKARGRPVESHNFRGQADCKLHCFKSGNTYMNTGNVDDGTHCSLDSGACVAGVCMDMPDYSAPTSAPPSGPITGKYTGTPSSSIWDNVILTVPNGATSVTITNKKFDDVEIAVGYRRSRRKGYNFAENKKMDRNVKRYGLYERTRTTVGVTYKYRRDKKVSTIKIAGPVQPTAGYSFVLFVRGKKPAQISWSYTA